MRGGVGPRPREAGPERRPPRGHGGETQPVGERAGERWI